MPRTMKRHDTADPITGTASDEFGPVDLSIYERSPSRPRWTAASR